MLWLAEKGLEYIEIYIYIYNLFVYKIFHIIFQLPSQKQYLNNIPT